jgi:ubiquinone/menaquinone biosynthesis C-methylase UbiE
MNSVGPALADCERASANLACIASEQGDNAVWAIKVFLGVNFFLWHLDAFARREDPTPAFIRLCEEGSKLLRGDMTGSLPVLGTSHSGVPPALRHQLYSSVYSALSDREYFEESRDVLRGRLQANAVSPERLFGGKVVLDAGCGGGKFTQAIAGFGAAEVIGVDVEEGNIEFARQQAGKVAHGSEITYCVGSVLNLPIRDASVDFVWCNSVAHLTGNQDAVLAEFSRVLKPQGELFYYVNGRFGLFEILLKLLVQLMKGVPTVFVQHFLQSLGMGAGRISWLLACMFAPYEFVPRAEIEKWLVKRDFPEFRLLDRGIDIDYSEKIARGEPFADIKYGEGQLKYLAKKSDP